jgi:hypothetical protein
VGGFDGPHSFDLSIDKAKICGLRPFNEPLLVPDALSERFLCLHTPRYDRLSRKLDSLSRFRVPLLPNTHIEVENCCQPLKQIRRARCGRTLPLFSVDYNRSWFVLRFSPATMNSQGFSHRRWVAVSLILVGSFCKTDALVDN